MAPSSKLQPSLTRIGKPPNRKKRNPKANRRKNSAWMQEHSKIQPYQPPRLQDLQFQNRLKAFRHYGDRRDATMAHNSMRAPMVDGSVTGFGAMPFNTARFFAADTSPGTLAYAGKGVVTMSGLDPRVHYMGKTDANPLTAFGIHKFSGAYDYACRSDVVMPRATGKFSNAVKHRGASHRSRKAFVGPHKHPDAPAAPRNTTSFLMRAKKSGGIASFVSPSPVTSAIIRTPSMSPFVGLAHEANHDWGVNDYGSMSGLIHLRPLEFGHEYGDSESEVEQGAESLQQLEQRLDQDVSRFVMTYPSTTRQDMGQNLLETRMGDQDSHIEHLEEENMELKERLFSMQQEVEYLRSRIQCLEGASSGHDAEAESSPGRSVADISGL